MKAISERELRHSIVAGFTALAWGAFWLWSRAYGPHLHHAAVAPQFVGSGAGPILVFASGWALMTIAMMVPTAYPLLARFYCMTGSRDYRVWLVSSCIAGYVAVWIAFGVAAEIGVAAVHDLTAASAFQAGLLVLAGLYQFSSLKYHCLKKCRSPFSFISAHWRGKNEWLESFWLGVHHGLFCIGCCWALMLLMFLAVSAHFLWMLILGTIMAIEKNASWGERISAPLGVLFVALGIVAVI